MTRCFMKGFTRIDAKGEAAFCPDLTALCSLHRCRPRCTAEGITHIDAKGDGRHFISNGKDQAVKLWDLRRCHSQADLARGVSSMRGLPRYQWCVQKTLNLEPSTAVPSAQRCSARRLFHARPAPPPVVRLQNLNSKPPAAASAVVICIDTESTRLGSWLGSDAWSVPRLGVRQSA